MPVNPKTDNTMVRKKGKTMNYKILHRKLNPRMNKITQLKMEGELGVLLLPYTAHIQNTECFNLYRFNMWE